MTTPNEQLILAELIRKASDEARQLARMNAGPPLDAPAYLRKAFPTAATAALEAYESELAAMGLEGVFDPATMSSLDGPRANT